MKLKDIFGKLSIGGVLFSHDIQTQVSAVLLNRKSKLAEVWESNRFIDYSLRDKLPNTRPNKYHYIQHAEARLIYRAAKEGIKTNNSIVVCSHSPCLDCVRILFQAGVDTLYFKHVRSDLDNLNYSLDIQGKLAKLKSGYYKLKLSVRK